MASNHQEWDEEYFQLRNNIEELKISLPYIKEKIEHLETQCDHNSEVVNELRRIDCGQQEVLKHLQDSIERLEKQIQTIEEHSLGHSFVNIPHEDDGKKYKLTEDALKIVLIAIAVVAFVITNGITFPL